MYEEGVSSYADQEYVVKVIAHELAHMWFGDIVTCDWWTDLWLNEGFASWVENLGVEHWLPESGKRDREVFTHNNASKCFCVRIKKVIVKLCTKIIYDGYLLRMFLEHRVAALAVDGLDTTKAISADVTNPYYTKTSSTIVYDKGACLLLMIEGFLSFETFVKGVNQYLKNNVYSTAMRYDLWQALDAAALEDGISLGGYDMGTIMESWSLQKGYPIVNVKMGDEGTQLILTQERYFLDPSLGSAQEQWYIPINYALAGGDFETIPPPSLWLGPNSSSVIEFPSDGTSTPFVLNVQSKAYFRVNYPADNWIGLTDALVTNPDSIHKLNRAAVVDDAMSLARSGKLDYSTALGVTTYLGTEAEYIPFKAGVDSFEHLEIMLRSTEEDHVALRDYVISLLGNLYSELVSFEVASGDPMQDILFQIELIEWMCMYGYADCVNNANQRFGEWMDSGTNDIAPDLKQSVYKVAIREGSVTEFDFLLEKLLTVGVANEVNKIIYGLGNTRNVHLPSCYVLINNNL